MWRGLNSILLVVVPQAINLPGFAQIFFSNTYPTYPPPRLDSSSPTDLKLTKNFSWLDRSLPERTKHNTEHFLKFEIADNFFLTRSVTRSNVYYLSLVAAIWLKYKAKKVSFLLSRENHENHTRVKKWREGEKNSVAYFSKIQPDKNHCFLLNGRLFSQSARQTLH